MTGDDEELSMKAIGTCRNLNRKAANECAKHGICPEDIGIAALYSAFDIAQEVKGDQVLALEWLRTGLDLMERQITGGETAH